MMNDLVFEDFVCYVSVHACVIYLLFLKSLSPSKKNICLNDSPSKIMKNAFYFNLKALLFHSQHI